MNEIVIIVGMMGVGKTTFALRYSEVMGHRYINFDQVYHEEIQKGKYDVALKQKMIEYIKNLPEHPFVVDGWYTWEKKWYLQRDDSLRELSGYRNIRVIYLKDSKDRILKRYFVKHHPRQQRVQDDYCTTYDARLAALEGNLFGLKHEIIGIE